MGMRLVFVAAVIMSVAGIKVPIDKTNESTQTKAVDTAESSEKPIYYESKNDQVDSHLVPPNSHHHLENISDEIATLATYLLPPSEDKRPDYKPTEAGEQTDWYPIAPAVSPLSRQLLPPKHTKINPVLIETSQSEPIFGSFGSGQILDARARQVPVPSRDLQPPLENASNDYVYPISDEVINIPFENEGPARPAGYPISIWDGPVISFPDNNQANSFVRSPYIAKKYKNPTNLYPKKYAGAFKPIPIPVTQIDEESLAEKQNGKPLKEFKGNKNNDDEFRAPGEDKTIHKFEEAQKKRVSKKKPENIKVDESETDESTDVQFPEQDTSATNHKEPSRQAYPAPSRQAQKHAPVNQGQSHAPPADGDRTEFRMHGMKGPHSYQFGFDTGKGKNRQFRFEERDNNGRVKGHYGYMDKTGKLRVVNYDADPEHGFRAEAPVESE